MMKITILSTYPPLKCGIAYYTRDLIKAMDEKGDFNIVVLSSGNSLVSGNVNVIESWKRGQLSSFFKVIHNINNINPGLIHIQFHPALYGGPVFSSLFIIFLLIYLKLHRKKIIITMHTIPIIKSRSQYFLLKSIIGLLTILSDKVIVHTTGQKQLLLNSYNVDEKKISIIPIGINKTDGLGEDELNKFIIENQLDRKFIILSCPHLRFGLELEYIMEAVARCKSNDIICVINGLSPATHDRETRYLNQLQGLRERLGLQEKVRFITDRLLWEDTRLLWCQIANVIIYSHSSYPSEDSSMSLGEALGLYKPLIVFDVPKFREVAAELRENGFGELVVPDIATEEKIMYISRTIEKVKRDYLSYSNKLREILRSFVERRTWAKIARKTYNVYNEVLNERIS